MMNEGRTVIFESTAEVAQDEESYGDSYDEQEDSDDSCKIKVTKSVSLEKRGRTYRKLLMSL